ncbi:hypothetical protein GCM10009720_28180 [Yaniella flava]|uniref:Uncharacterized protein n=1 Tax=Yaniella flava TaxID=287930 RepID=A0ABP5GME1_9MICC
MGKRAPERRVIRLCPDYGRDWPLWESSTPTRAVGYTTDPEIYDLSEQLSQDMARWNAFWEQHFDPFEGWDDHESRERWRREGERIAACLCREVVLFADVQYEPWPLEELTPEETPQPEL